MCISKETLYWLLSVTEGDEFSGFGDGLVLHQAA